MNNNRGTVFGTTINHSVYILLKRLQPLYKYKSKITYSEIEEVQDNSEIKHRVIKAVLNNFGIFEGIELTTLGDLKSSLGLGSSSAFLVGMVNAINELQGRSQQEWFRPQSLYDTVTFIEQEILKDNIGLQDAAHAAFGGLAKYEWEPKTHKIHRVRYQYHTDELDNNLLLYHSGIDRKTNANDVAGSYIDTLESQSDTIKKMVEMADDGWWALYNENYDEIGELIYKSWKLKRSLSSNIVPGPVDQMAKAAIDAGALGFKTIGAGGGGCFLVYAPKDRQISVRSALKGLVEIPFRFNDKGSEVILNQRSL